MRQSAWLVVFASVLLPACYHATIETGATPSTVTVEKTFASSWIGGLVPPSTIEVASKCTTGVAKVETQLSFVNMLVGFLTGGIYTPMDIRVTCAQGGKAMGFVVPASAGADQQVAVLTAAAERSAADNAPVYVGFTR
jgi:hypothetical protein